VEERVVTEIAQIEVKPGMEAEFEAGVNKARPIFLRSKGCKEVSLTRSIERPQRYRLMVQWETVENHTVDFRSSENFAAWRACVQHCFDGTPQVEHVSTVMA
jgi:heme-degrading monooxygenase HmoA